MSFKITLNKMKGSQHAMMELVCQDACGSFQNENTAAVVLCDGAGSAEHSEYASGTIAEKMPEFLGRHFENLYDMEIPYLKGLLVTTARDLLKKEYPEAEAKCTFLALAIDESGRYLAMHIGDGMIFHTENEKSEVLSYPENGEYSNITYFLSESNAIQHLRVYRGTVKTTQTFLLCSDGISGSMYNAETGKTAKALEILGRWLTKYEPSEAEELIQRELGNLFSKHTSDDMSIAQLQISFSQDEASEE